jgi:5-methyltetrahydrofolate--homocysteine methyltransferase
MLQELGLPAGECPEGWNLTHRDRVLEVARAYVEAGSRIILTNSFGGNRFILEGHGLSDRAEEICRTSAEISREAAGRDAWVFASVGPTGKIVMMGEIEESDFYDAFKAQVLALAEGGADAILCESMSQIEEIELAVRAVKENTDLPAVGSMTFDSGENHDRTMMGVTPEQAVEKLSAAGADIVGANCGGGIEHFIPVAKRMRAVTDKPIWMKPNAGLPILKDGKQFYPEPPDKFAAAIPELIRAGANIVGGCCGTSPDYIRKIAEIMEKENIS